MLLRPVCVDPRASHLIRSKVQRPSGTRRIVMDDDTFGIECKLFLAVSAVSHDRAGGGGVLSQREGFYFATVHTCWKHQREGS